MEQYLAFEKLPNKLTRGKLQPQGADKLTRGKLLGLPMFRQFR